MKVLYCIGSVAGGGAERQLCYLCREMCSACVDVHVALARGGPNLTRLRETGANVHFLGREGWSIWDPRRALALLTLVRVERPDIVHTWLPMMDLLGGLVSELTRRPWLLSERSSEFAVRKGLVQMVRNLIAGRADGILANSPSGVRFWRRRFPRKLGIFRVPNILPMKEIYLAQPVSRQAFGFSDDQKVVLYVGRFVRGKNISRLVDAIVRVVRDNPQYVGVLCGDGPLRLNVIGRIEQEGLSDRILLPGYVNQVWGLMKMADVFVSVGYFEGTPNTVIEAIACGCPLVISDIREHRDLLEESMAIFVNPHEVEGIRYGLVEALRNTRLGQVRSALAKKRLAAFDGPTVCRDHMKIYEEICDRRACLRVCERNESEE